VGNTEEPGAEPTLTPIVLVFESMMGYEKDILGHLFCSTIRQSRQVLMAKAHNTLPVSAIQEIKSDVRLSIRPMHA
jgi:hypothetical protein